MQIYTVTTTISGSQHMEHVLQLLCTISNLQTYMVHCYMV